MKSWLGVLAILAVWLSMIFTLYLAPTASKYIVADALSIALLIIVLGVYRLHSFRLTECIGPIVPLLVLMGYVVAQNIVNGGNLAADYIRELLIGFIPYLLFYVLLSHQSPTNTRVLVVSVLLLPGLVHIAYMYFDVYNTIHHGEVPLVSSSRHGLLEYVKDAPRVGRRYLSMALIHLLCGGLLMARICARVPVNYFAWVVSGLSLLSITLLDARAAYVSAIFGGALFVGAVGMRPLGTLVRTHFRMKRWQGLALICLVLGAVALGFNAGKSRWMSMTYSLKAAVHDVFDETVVLNERPYVNASYWSAPIDDVEKCYLEKHFRCKVDQSAYLRMAWLLVGVQSLVDHPLGIGHSDNYMGHLWGVAGDERHYQRGDSFLIEHMVSFGLPGIALYVWMLWGLLRTLRHSLNSGKFTITLLVVGGLILVCIGRSLIDTLSEGLWRYVMALLGMYYGILHSKLMEDRELIKCGN